MTAITALTAQNTLGVRAIHGVPPQMLSDQIDAVIEDIGADAVKIGMLHAPDIVRTVAQAIDRHALPNVVLDSGHGRDQRRGADRQSRRLPSWCASCSRAPYWSRPTSMRLRCWSAAPLADEEAMQAAAQELLARGARRAAQGRALAAATP